MQKILRVIFLTLTAVFWRGVAEAQWTAQTLTLRPGWNAVFLEIEPEPNECDRLFADLPVESVWAWNRRFSSVQFIQDPETLVPGQPDWLTYVAQGHPGRAAVNLFTLEGNRAYLIKLPSNAAPVTWMVWGRPVIRGINWMSDSFNFVGFHVSRSDPPTFQNFFAPAPAHAGKPVYRMNTAGYWERVTNPSAMTMRSGEAYWVRCDGQSSYTGPLSVSLELRNGLDYGRSLVEQTLRLRNTSVSTNTFTVRKLPTATPPNSNAPALAGEVPLSYFRMDLANNQIGWVQLPNELVQMSIPPGEEWALRLEVRRADMAAFSAASTSAGGSYQSLLEVTDAIGTRYLVPVMAEELRAANGLLAGPAPPHVRAGLWVGSVVLNKVNEPFTSNNTPVPTDSEFQFRLIVHVDNNGRASLLQKVVQLWKDGTYTNDAQGMRVVDQPGRFVLITDEALVGRYSGSTLRDGRAVGRRISSAAFGFRAPVPLTGPFGSTDSPLGCALLLDYDNELNPFKHRFHPDHNNLDDSPLLRPLPFKTDVHGLRYTDESYSVKRDIHLQFTAADPDNLSLAGWGDNQLGGDYREEITGLHRDPIHLQGTFRLHHVSRVGVLNDQN